jgi:hypothetical protein
VHFFYIFGFWGVWSAVRNRSDRFCGTGLTGFGNRPDRFVPRIGTCSGWFVLFA